MNSFSVSSFRYLSSSAFILSIYLASRSIYPFNFNYTSIFSSRSFFRDIFCSSNLSSISLCVSIVLSNCFIFISTSCLEFCYDSWDFFDNWSSSILILFYWEPTAAVFYNSSISFFATASLAFRVYLYAQFLKSSICLCNSWYLLSESSSDIEKQFLSCSQFLSRFSSSLILLLLCLNCSSSSSSWLRDY